MGDKTQRNRWVEILKAVPMDEEHRAEFVRHAGKVSEVEVKFLVMQFESIFGKVREELGTAESKDVSFVFRPMLDGIEWTTTVKKIGTKLKSKMEEYGQEKILRVCWHDGMRLARAYEIARIALEQAQACKKSLKETIRAVESGSYHELLQTAEVQIGELEDTIKQIEQGEI